MLEFDCVISFGTTCQVGEALWNYSLRHTDSVFDHMGFKDWKQLISIVENDFDGFYAAENIRPMGVMNSYSVFSEKYMDCYNVYETKYQLHTDHFFEVGLNPQEELPAFRTYEQFRERMDRKIAEFRYQVNELNSVLFLTKILDSKLTAEEVELLYSTVSKLRKGKSFALHLYVDEAENSELISHFEHAAENLKVFGYTVKWNHDAPNAEWDKSLKGVTVTAS